MLDARPTRSGRAAAAPLGEVSLGGAAVAPSFSFPVGSSVPGASRGGESSRRTAQAGSASDKRRNRSGKRELHSSGPV